MASLTSNAHLARKQAAQIEAAREAKEYMDRVRDEAYPRILQELREHNAARKRRRGEDGKAEQSSLFMEDVVQRPEATVVRSESSSPNKNLQTNPLAAWNPRKDRHDDVVPVPALPPVKKSKVGIPSQQSNEKAPARPALTLDAGHISTKATPLNSVTSSAAGRSESPPRTTPITGSANASTPTNPSTDRRRTSLASLPKIQTKAVKQAETTSPQSPDGVGRAPGSAVPKDGPPKWYVDLAVPKTRGRDGANADTLMQNLRNQVTKAKKDPFGREKVFMEIRDKLHKIVFTPVTAIQIKQQRMFHNVDGLRQLFDSRYSGGIEWPFDIRADSEELFNKWCRQDFGTDILRGIKFGTEKKEKGPRSGDSIDPQYEGRVKADYFGNGELVNGQWWPTQLTALRDGAHGVSQGGVSGSGKNGDGAYSVVMSGGHGYDDEDHGDWVLYCGTDSNDGNITTYTSFLINSHDQYILYKNQGAVHNPVRLLRSHNLESKWAPVDGFRYDGLYDVVGYEMLDETDSIRQRHRFRLERCDGQDPIRGGDGPEKRPTEQESAEYKKHKKLIGGKGSV